MAIIRGLQHSHDESSPTRGATATRPRAFSTVLDAARSAAHRFTVELVGETVSILASAAATRRLCEHVFLEQIRDASAEDGAIDDAEPPERPWTVAALACDDAYASCQATSLEPSCERTDSPSLSSYWRPDHHAELVYRSPGLALVTHRAPIGGFTLFDLDRRLVAYIRRAGDNPYLPHIEHLISYPARMATWSKGWLDVHAAFVRYRGRGLILSGPKRAGKTSLAMHLLARGGSMLGNDMALLHPVAGARPRAVALPHICRITRETIRDNATLDAAFGDRFDRNRSFLTGPVFADGKFGMYSSGLDQLYRRALHIRSMRVDAILFPRFDRTARRQHLAGTSRVDGLARLARSISTDPPVPDWLPFPHVAQRAALEQPLLEALADSTVDAFELAFGRQRTLNWQEIDALVDSL